MGLKIIDLFTTVLLALYRVTTKASWFELKLSRAVSSPSYLVTCISISAKDVLLDIASSSFEHRNVFGTGDIAHRSGDGSRLLLIIDDLDVIVGNADETGSDLESEQIRALNAIVKLVDSATNNGSSSRRCFVLGICRSTWSRLPPHLARVGRFEKEVVMSPPTIAQRRVIFGFWLSTLPLLDNGLDGDTTVARWSTSLAPRTAGCVAADIRRICADALTIAASRVPRTSSINESTVTFEDVKEAARTCVPSELSSLDVIPASSADSTGYGAIVDSKREFESAWMNFGGYDDEKKRLYRAVVRPWKYHILESASSIGLKDDAQSLEVGTTLELSRPSGVLFHGPSGCGKSMAALCLASSLGLHCVKVSDMPHNGLRSIRAAVLKSHFLPLQQSFCAGSSIGSLQSMARWFGSLPPIDIFSSQGRVALYSFLRRIGCPCRESRRGRV
jgi:SpoVK/Ycf46/Vps4 family AAA+-type ATPase